MPAHHLPAARVHGGRTAMVLLALALVVLLALTGCGGKDSGNDSGKAPGEAKSGEASGETSGTSKSPSASEEAAPDPGAGAPKVGECHRMSAEQSVASVSTSKPVSCRRPHTSVVAHISFLRAPVTPKTPIAERRALGKKLCEPAYRRLAGGTLADRAMSILTWTLFTPGQDDLVRGARWVRCDVVARSGTELVRLPSGTPLLAKGIPDDLRACQTTTGADVSCAQPHAFKVQAVFLAYAAKRANLAYPDPTAFTATARARCKQLTGADGGFWQPPSRVGWNRGDHYIRCLVQDS